MRTGVPAILYVWSRTQISHVWASDPSLTVIRDSEGQIAPDFTTRGAVSYAYGAGTGTHEYETRFALPEEQKTARDLVRRVAAECRVPLRVVDLGHRRHWVGRRAAHKKGWTEFPVLVTPDGEALVGAGALSERRVFEVLTRGTVNWNPGRRLRAAGRP